MKLHLPAALRSAVFSCFTAVCALSTTLATGTLLVYAAYGTMAYAAYNAATTTFEGTNNGAINPTAATYSGVETLIFNMGTSGTGNHLSNDSWSYDGNIQIGAAGATQTGLCLNNGNRNQTDVFTGKVTGTGLFSKTGAGTNLVIAFEGDVTEFTGAIRLGSSAAFTLRFGGGAAAPANQSAAHGVSGTGDITFIGTDKDTLTYNYSTGAPVYITNRIITNAGATSKVAFNGRAHYVLTKDAAISALTLGANNTLHIGTTGHSSATVLGALTMGAGAAVHVDNGSLEVLNATSLAGMYAIGTEGVLHLSRTAALDGSLTVAQGGALSIGALSGFSAAGGGLQTPAAGENGFAAVNGKLSILTGSADKLQALAGTTVLYEGKNLELAEDGTVTIEEVDYSAYYLRSGEKTLSSLVAESDNKLTRIEMGTGAKLAVDFGAVQGSYSVVENARFVALSELGSSTIADDIRIDNLSATETVTVASGATLSIGSTAEGFSRDINLSADSHLVFEAGAPTAMSVGSIINTADRKDDFRRSVRVGEGVGLQASSIVNSWGMESLTVDGELNISGALSYETGGSRWGNSPANNLIEGEGHITAGSLNISNASEYNTISVHELTINGASSIGCATTISGGTTELLGTATVSAALNLTGGHLILGDELSDTAILSGSINLSAGELTLNGTTSLGSNLHQTGGTLTVNGELTQTATLTASGTIALNGTLKAASSALDAIGDITYSEGVNGYRQGTFVLVNQGEGAFSLQRGEQSTVLLDGKDATSFLSTDASGNILLADTVGSVYHVFEGEAVYGGDTSTVDTARTTGFGLHGGSLSLLAEREGGHHLELTADADVTLGAGVSLSAASVTGAEHLTLSGAGTYVVNTLAELSVVTRSVEWTGTTHINDRISMFMDDVTEVSHSGNLRFSQPLPPGYGGVITNQHRFILADNGSLTFCSNQADVVGGAIYNVGEFEIQRNADIVFTDNHAANGGGAICVVGGNAVFTMSENGNVSFSENTVTNRGGAIYNNGTFILSGNGDVVFEKNAEVANGVYRLRSVYSVDTLNLSASEGKSILFKDSVYARGTVNLNLDGTGDIVFTGASTEVDLREMKGSDGTAQEIAESRSSVLDTTVSLGGGTLQVRDAASLTVKNLTAAAGSELVLHDASFTTTGDSTLAAISVSGSSVLASQAGATLTLTQAIANSGELTISGAINADALALEHVAAASEFVNAAGESDTSGFSVTSDIYRVALTDGAGTVNGAGAVISHSALPSDIKLSLGSNGMATTGDIDYSTYYINGGSAALSSILAASPTAAVQMTGGLLTIDTDTNAVIGHDKAAALDVTAHLSGNRDFSEYASVVFHDISAGGILNIGGSTFTMSGNGNVSFNGNTYSGQGGAIFNGGTVVMNNNEAVTFSGNAAEYDGIYVHNLGGAISNARSFTMSGNRNVTISGNSAYSEGDSYGGAISNTEWGSFTLSGNEGVAFNGNTITSLTSSASGGAISCGENSVFSISNNSSVAFSGNKAIGAGGYYTVGNGGAIMIMGHASLALSGNESVTFSGNKASSLYGRAYGGAIRIDYSGSFSLSGNGDVLFEKNAEVANGVYRLRSIYSTRVLGWDEPVLNLSASENHSITFRDSIYAEGVVNLNQDGTGDIIFTGATTEADLREMKGSDGTAQEIAASRTSDLGTNARLYSGRLVVEDKAVLLVNGLSVASDASVVVKDGTLQFSNGCASMTTASDATKAVLTGASLGESSLAGADAEHRGTVNGARIDLAEGANFTMQHLVLGATSRITDDPATLVLDDVTVELELGVNATLRAEEVLQAGTTLVQNGAAEVTLTPGADATVLHYEATSFDSVTLSGSSLVLELGGVDVEMFNGANFIAISFTSGTGEAIFDSTLPVTLSVNGLCSEPGYTVQGADKATTMYFLAGKELAEATPEPSTTTLSLLALAALAARRKRK